MRRFQLGLGLCATVLAAGCANDGSGSGDTDQSSLSGDGDGDGDSQGDGDGDGDGDSQGDGDGDGDGDEAPKFDVAGDGDGDGDGDCDQICGNDEWSYVWLANSGQNTISKINTRTMTEEGRYYTRPDQSGNPSRTSVSIDAKAVVVANRMGGVTKIWAREEFCDDKNNNGQIDTSTGPNDILPFDQEECIAWYTPFADATSQRPVAWTPGDYNQETCQYDNQQVWTAMAKGTPGETWPCTGSDGIWTYLLNGETGEIDEEIHMPDVTCGTTLGPYGAAVNADGDVWMYIWSAFTVVNVKLDTLEYSTLSGGSYGITVDTEGRPWTDSPRRLNLQTMQWENAIGQIGGAGGSGVTQDLQGRIWKSTNDMGGGVGWVDMDTMEVGDIVDLPVASNHRGVGVDVDGFIWAVPLGGTTAWKIDPDTYETEMIDGLNSPYTYSDFGGGQLNNVTCNPEG